MKIIKNKSHVARCHHRRRQARTSRNCSSPILTKGTTWGTFVQERYININHWIYIIVLFYVVKKIYICILSVYFFNQSQCPEYYEFNFTVKEAWNVPKQFLQNRIHGKTKELMCLYKQKNLTTWRLLYKQFHQWRQTSKRKQTIRQLIYVRWAWPTINFILDPR